MGSELVVEAYNSLLTKSCSNVGSVIIMKISYFLYAVFRNTLKVGLVHVYIKYTLKI